MILYSNVNIQAQVTSLVPAGDSRVIYGGTGWADWNSCKRTSTAGDRATLNFTGMSISVILGKNHYNAGLANVKIDGSICTAIGCYSNAKWGSGRVDTEVLISTGLTNQAHTLELTVTGTREIDVMSSWSGADPNFAIYAFRFGDYNFGVIKGRTLDPDGDALVQVNLTLTSGTTVYQFASNDAGLYCFCGIVSGNYSLTASKAGYETKIKTGIIITEGQIKEIPDLLFPETSGHILYNRIYQPHYAVPIIKKKGESFDIVFKSSANATGWSASLATKYNTYSLNINSSLFNSTSGFWTLNAAIPSAVPEELYDLAVNCNLAADTKPRAVKVVAFYKTTFYFMINADPQENTPVVLPNMLKEANIMNPEFILFPGDLVEAGGDSSYNNFVNCINNNSIIPTYCVSGNHDIGAVGAFPSYPVYKKYFGRRYYSFDYGNCHYLGMDNGGMQQTNPFRWDEGHWFADQFDWCKKDLANHMNSSLRIPFLHIIDLASDMVWWFPSWMEEDYQVKYCFYGHMEYDEKATHGSIPTTYVCTIGGRAGYRMVRVQGANIVSYTYGGDPVKSMRVGNFSVNYSSSNDGTQTSITANIYNNLNEHFENGLVKFVMKRGNYITSWGTMTQTINSDDGTKSICYIQGDIPAVSTTTIMVYPDTAVPVITVQSPNGGESWTQATLQTVTWTSINVTNNVDIEISSSGIAGPWTALVSSTANDGAQIITVPAIVSTACRIRVKDTSETPFDISDNNFTITSDCGCIPSIDPTTLDFGNMQNGQNKTMAFNIANTGLGTMTGTISSDRAWLTVNPSSFSGNIITDSVTINTTGLTIGQSTGIVSVITNMGNVKVNVTVNVAPPVVDPFIHVSSMTLSFGELEMGTVSQPQTLTITNMGGGTLTGTISTNDSWIKIDQTSFSLGAGQNKVINVTADNSAMKQKEGTVTGTIMIISNSIGSPPVTEITVEYAATCVLVKPNPVRLSSPLVGEGKGEGVITFFGDGIVPGQTKIIIYTLSGNVVADLSAPDNATAPMNGQLQNEITWAPANLSPGIYIYTYESPKEKGVGKFTVIQK